MLSSSIAAMCTSMQAIKNMGELQKLSDKLWLIANNSKSFVSNNKAIIRNNLGLSKCSETNLI